MRNLRVLVVLLAIVGLSSVASASPFVENFDSYAPGDSLHGQGGWKGWDNVPFFGAPASNAQANSPPNSAEIGFSADLVHEFDFVGGNLELSVMQYIPIFPMGMGNSYFILLNDYTDGGPYDWSVQLNFDMVGGLVFSDFADGASLPIIWNQWVQLKLLIDLDNNTVSQYYDGIPLATHQWDDDGSDTLQAIDLFAGGTSPIYYDDLSITAPGPAPVPEPATMLLLGSGILGLAGFRRRFRKG